MVHNTPDPPKEEPSLSDTANIPVMAATDSEDEIDADHEGYTMLPQDANDDELSENEEMGEEPGTTATQAEADPTAFDRGTAEDIRAVWNTPSTVDKEPLNEETTEQILKAMKGFTLPTSAIPPWASEIGEEDWKQHLLNKIRSEK